MTMNWRELWTVMHGMVFGAIFLLSFGGGLAELWSLRPEWVTSSGLRDRVRRILWGTWAMALAAWATVISGTYVVYPWYRDPAPGSPRSEILADPATMAWHTFGMEWKEHVGWVSPILATAVAFIVTYSEPA